MATNWHVIGQETRPSIEPGGRMVQVVDIRYQVDVGPAAGHVSQVTVSQAQYNADTVRALIDEAVDKATAIADL